MSRDSTPEFGISANEQKSSHLESSFIIEKSQELYDLVEDYEMMKSSISQDKALKKYAHTIRK